MGVVFGIIGVVHFVFRKRFFALTETFESHDAKPVGLFDPWNFLFYLSIGLAIVLAVRVGGVIPIFSYIVVPPVAAIMLARKKSSLVIVALIVSVLGSFLGLYFSVQFDFPAGSSIVAILGGLFLVAAALMGIRQRKSDTVQV